MTIARKITVLCGTLLLLNLALGVSALVYMSHMSDDSRLLASNTVSSVYLAGRINTGAKAILIRMIRHMSSDSPQQMTKFETYLTDRNKQVREEMQAYEKLVLTDRDRQLLQRIRADLDRTIEVWQTVRPLSVAGKKREAVELFDKEGVVASDDLDSAAKELVALNKAESETIGKRVEANSATARFWIMGILLSAFASGGVLSFLLVRSLNRVLRRTVEEMSAEASHVLSAAGMISAASQALASAASQQAASLEETSASGTEISSTAGRNAENAHSAAALVEQSQKRFSEANQSVEHMAKAMRDIDSSSNKISQIIKDIDEIAFQTNIIVCTN